MAGEGEAFTLSAGEWVWFACNSPDGGRCQLSCRSDANRVVTASRGFAPASRDDSSAVRDTTGAIVALGVVLFAFMGLALFVRR